MPPPHSSPAADRFRAFAFAAADLLVETSPEGRIGFAAGAFEVRFGAPADSFVGRPLDSLFAPADAGALDLSLSFLAARGRLAPVVLRLADRAGTPVTLSGLQPPGGPSRFCFTIGPVAQAASEDGGGLPGGRGKPMLQAAEALLRSGRAGTISLLEVRNWRGTRAKLSEPEHRALRARIDATLAGAAPGAVAGEMGEGRYGLLGASDADVAAITERLRHLLKDSGGSGAVTQTGLQLTAGRLPPAQAVRALRYALGRYAEGGTEAAMAAAGEGGLEGVIALAERRAVALRDVIARRRFRLSYQPIVSLADRSLQHYEGLLRPIAMPGFSVQSTQDFVTFVEAVGLSEDLDLAVIDTALETMRALTATDATLSIAVNISGLSMQSARFRAALADRLEAPSVPRDAAGAPRIMLELTETAEINDMEGAAATITALRTSGVKVCLDDFGSGHAAFSYLRAFSVDLVKLDGVYVQGALAGPHERSFVAAMVDLAALCGARIVAEKIETEAEADLMRGMGVQYGQGWLFGRPGALPGGRR